MAHVMLMVLFYMLILAINIWASRRSGRIASLLVDIFTLTATWVILGIPEALYKQPIHLIFEDKSVGQKFMDFGLDGVDMSYPILFPLLVSFLLLKVSNHYSSSLGLVMGLVIRVLSGTPVEGLKHTIHFPCLRPDVVPVQLFPFRTTIMLISLVSILLFSSLASRRHRRNINLLVDSLTLTATCVLLGIAEAVYNPTRLAFKDNGLMVSWLLGMDMSYSILFPQLVSFLLFKVSNGYGSIVGLVVGLVLRMLSGEPLIGLEPFIHFPCLGRDADGKLTQFFPFRTAIVLISLALILLFSSLASIVGARWNVFNLHHHRQKKTQQKDAAAVKTLEKID